MNRVFADVSFRGKFRSYQQEVLDEAGRYLADKKIHIVAAPGSGKTILGLELVRRLGRPALILGPYHLWFLFMIAGLYLCQPFFRPIAADGGRSRYFLLPGRSVPCWNGDVS